MMRDGRPIDHDGRADRVERSAETRLPEVMTDDCEPLPLVGLLRREQCGRARAAHRAPRRSSMRLCATLICSDPLVACERQPHGIGNSHVSEALALRAPLIDVSVRRSALTKSLCRNLGPEHRQLLGRLIRKRPQEHGVEHAEDRGVRANAEREREHGDGSKAGILSQRPKGVSKVLSETGHADTVSTCMPLENKDFGGFGRSNGRSWDWGSHRRTKKEPAGESGWLLNNYLLTSGARNGYGASHCPRNRRRSRSSAAPR